ncbi:MAG: ABC transporter ATP-binding protein [Saprospiraceae bacterium]|nr:ABC transporter ATP-binding protein [Saprospiraceae bacterium]MDP4999819.1 ABC transporter ATP-binding protein [Saprospiraceae bacterium]
MRILFHLSIPILISARNIQKSYGNLKVLKGVDLDIGAAEIVSIVGKSGAGKSTLLHILGTLDRPDSGSLRIGDAETSQLSGDKLADFRNQHIGFVFQFHHLLPEFTALENVCIPAWIRQTPEQEARKRALELLDYLGLSERVSHKPTQLSGGEQQRVAIARALINRPAVIFADEPTGNLDSASSQDLHQLLFRLRTDFGQTFVIVTHNNELAGMSDRVLVMKDGILINDQAKSYVHGA